MRWAYCIKLSRGQLQWSFVYADTDREAARKLPRNAYGGPLLCPPRQPQS